MKLKILLALLLASVTIMYSCKKDWLNEKRDLSLVVPSTLTDMRALLRNSVPQSYEIRGLAELAAGDYYITNTNYQSLATQQEKSGYIWKDDLFAGTTFVSEWDYNYQQVLTANVVLEGLEKITPDNSNLVEYNDVKGGALFMRSRAFWNLAQLFAKPYDANTSASDSGIPLRMASDINAKSVRATVQQTYDQIITDLQTAVGMLRPVALSRVDASRPVANALLARCYLSMRQYDKAMPAADQSLKDYSKLINYNTLSATSSRPFGVLNDEVLLPGTLNSYASFKPPVGKIDTLLYASYNSNDLRKTLFFLKNSDGTYSFKGMYSGSTALFGGFATDEMYLVRAECAARSGNLNIAASDLNTLLATRYKAATFTPYSFSDGATALSVILQERRKELLLRGLRWTDLRRLNKEPAYAVTIKRVLNGQTYTLPPNDPHYTFVIPDYVINASGIQQNVR